MLAVSGGGGGWGKIFPLAVMAVIPSFPCVLHAPRRIKPLNRAEMKWRRGWDSNPRAGITRPSDFESAPL